MKRADDASAFTVQFAVAFATSLAFKVALFGFAVSGAEGVTKVFRTWAKLGFCLGWDIVAAALVAVAATSSARVFARRGRIRAAFVAGAAWQSLYGVFSALSFEIHKLLGAPLDKTAIDLGFFTTEPGLRTALGGNLASSIAASLSWRLLPLFALAAGLPVLALRALAGLPRPSRRWRLASGTCASLFVALTLLVVPSAGFPTHGLERSPLPLLASSYLLAPLRDWRAGATATGDPFCFELRDPTVSVADRTAADNPLRAARPRPTNVALVVLESVSSALVAHPSRPMPFLDELRASPASVDFTAHYTHWPQTMQAMFSLLCSEMPSPDYRPISLTNPAIPCASLSTVLKQEGYATALFYSSDFDFDRQLRFYRHRRFDALVDRHGLPATASAWHNSWGIDERETVRAVLDWVGERGEAPFFVVYQMISGHHPYEFPGHPFRRDLTLEAEHAEQRATLGWIDDRLRDLHAGLAAAGRLDDTLLVVVADHGPGSGRLGRLRDTTVYEEAVHVPLVVHGPQLAATGGRVRFPTGHVDLAPTLLGLLGLEPPFQMKGRNLVRDDAPRLVVVGTRPPISQIGVVAEHWKLVHWLDTGASELYRLADDPRERRNLAGAHPEVVAPLLGAAERWRRQSRYLLDNYAAVVAKAGRRCDDG